MTFHRLMSAAALFVVFGFLAGLAWDGPMDDGVGRYQEFFALLVNGAVGLLGQAGAAGLFLVLGFLLSSAILFSGRQRQF